MLIRLKIIIPLVLWTIIFGFCLCGCFGYCKQLGGGYPFPKKYTIVSSYSKNQYPYLQVYCENEFNFQNAGTVTGSFTLSYQTDFDALCIEVVIPKLSWLSPEYDNKWMAHVSLPMTVDFEWVNKEGIKKKVTTSARPENAVYDGTTGDGCIDFEYVPLPCDTEINYTLTFDEGMYCRGYLSNGLEYNDGKKKTDRTADIMAHPENYTDFWKATFLVVEAPRKGSLSSNNRQKPARD